MKKLIFLFLIIMLTLSIVNLCGGEPIELTKDELIKIIQDSKLVSVGIKEVGFIKWIKANWWLFILSLVGIGRIFVFVTPTSKDDQWYGKWVLKPVRCLGKIISGGLG